MNNKKIKNKCNICKKVLLYQNSKHCSNCSNIYNRFAIKYPDKSYEELLEICKNYRRSGPVKMNQGRKPKYI